jgi:hypothetical protein
MFKKYVAMIHVVVMSIFNALIPFVCMCLLHCLCVWTKTRTQQSGGALPWFMLHFFFMVLQVVFAPICNYLLIFFWIYCNWFRHVLQVVIMIYKPATSVVSCIRRCTQRNLPLVCSSANGANGPPPARSTVWLRFQQQQVRKQQWVSCLALGATPREICYSFVAQPIKRKNLFCCTAAIVLLTSLTFLVHLHEQGALRWAKIPNLCFVARVASVEDEESAAADPAAAVVAAAAQQQQLLSCSTSSSRGCGGGGCWLLQAGYSLD